MKAAWGLAFMLCLAATAAQAGPPYVTDDPEPTDLHHWEIYSFGAGTKTPGQFDATAGVDLNYGALPGVQLTATIPVDLPGGARAKFGDLELGVKYRVLRREAAGVQLAVFPRVILPTADGRSGPGKVALLLPLWGQKDFGAWTLFGGGGWTLNTGDGNRNYWQQGIALTRTVSERVTLGAEIVHFGPDAAAARSYTAANLGAIIKLWGPFALLLSGGPGLAHARDGGTWNAYAALATNF